MKPFFAEPSSPKNRPLRHGLSAPGSRRKLTCHAPEEIWSRIEQEQRGFHKAERDAFHLHGLLPTHERALDEQIEARLKAFRSQPTSCFSEVWRKPRGVLSGFPNQHRIEDILADSHYDQVRRIVASDGERILGLGDQGADGMGIPIGKMGLITLGGTLRNSACLFFLMSGPTNDILNGN
jgi:malate dehydrogenase (oxaloacetate-decarboxylating)